MATKNPSGQEIWDVQRNDLMATASEKTIKRARWEHLRVTPVEGHGKVNVCNVSYGVQAKKDHTYTVTVEKGQPTDCTCPAAEYQEGPCKHVVKVADEPEVIQEAEKTNDVLDMDDSERDVVDPYPETEEIDDTPL